MASTTQPGTDPVDDAPVPAWLEYLTAGLGAFFGLLLLLMAFDSVRRMRQLDSELLDLVDTGDPDLSVVDRDPAA